MEDLTKDDWRTRVIEEKDALDAKLRALRGFIADTQFALLPLQDRELLHEQQHAMAIYSHVLGQRIANFMVTTLRSPTGYDEDDDPKGTQ